MRDGPGQFGQGYIGGIVRGEVVAQSVRSCITVDPALGLVVQASLAAWLITAATTAGRETNTEWLARVSVTVASARSDMARWAAGGIMRSSVATRYQDGLLRQAGSVIAPPSASTPPGT
jgi:hypothetical protein